jgi:WD40 repeat protein
LERLSVKEKLTSGCLLVVLSLFASRVLAQSDTLNRHREDQPVRLVQRGHGAFVNSLAFSSGGDLLVSGSGDATVSIWDVSSKAELAKFTNNSAPIAEVAFCTADHSVLWVSSDGTAEYWDLDTQTLKNGLDAQPAGMVFRTAALSPDCRYAFLGNGHGDSLLWDTTNQQLQEGIKIVHFEDVEGSSFSSDGLSVLLNSESMLGIVDTKTLAIQNGDLETPLSRAGFIREGDDFRIWAANGAGVFALGKKREEPPSPETREILTLLREQRCRNPETVIDRALCAPDDPNEHSRLHLQTTPLIRFAQAEAIGVSANGKYLAALEKGAVCIVELHTEPTVLKILPADFTSVTSIAVDDQADKIALGLSTGEIELLDAADGGHREELGSHLPRLMALALSSDLSRLTLIDDQRMYSAFAFPALSRLSLRTTTSGTKSVTQNSARIAKSFLGLGYVLQENATGGLVVLRLADNLASKVADVPLIVGKERKLVLAPPCFEKYVDPSYFIRDAALSDDGIRLFLSCGDGSVLAYKRVGEHYSEGRQLMGKSSGTRALAILDQNHLAIADGGRLYLSDFGHGTASRFEYAAHDSVDALYRGRNAHEVLIIRSSGVDIDIPNEMEWGLLLDLRDKSMLKFRGDVRNITTIDFVMPEQKTLITGSEDGVIRVWDVRDGQMRYSISAHLGPITAVRSVTEKMALSVGVDGTLFLWDLETGKEVSRTLGITEGNWLVSSEAGQFDASNLEQIRHLFWVFPDDPFHPLSPEIFLRDYYEPRLFSKLLEARKIPKPRPLQDLNRVQPVVQIDPIQRGAGSDMAQVTVEVSGNKGQFHRDGKSMTMQTDVYDLRLFRAGQLVGQEPEPKSEVEESLKNGVDLSPEQLQAWRCARRVRPDAERVKLDAKTGKLTRTFTVRLSHGLAGKQIEFTAYAFNEDRVKSETARATYSVPTDVGPVHKRAYLVTMGVNAYENKKWNLHFAANDAGRIQGALSKRLAGYEVVPVTLISDCKSPGCPENGDRSIGEDFATKAALHAVMEKLAGHELGEQMKRSLPVGIEGIGKAQPDDLVVIFVSSHGYTSEEGTFYIVPSDSGDTEGHTVESDLLRHWISSDELSAWVRDVDAGDLVMIVDTCHSAATVEEPGFKPGPMGSRGLGQLAYDKGMRILAASQADDVALESEKLKQGLLTYALVENGLEDGQAVGADGKITLEGWLQYAADRVPKLYEEVQAGQVQKFKATSKATSIDVELSDGASSLTRPSAFQQPSFFNFEKRESQIMLAVRLSSASHSVLH